MWTLYDGGVAGYQGTTWTHYSTVDSALPSDFVWAIAVDATGSVWVGTNKGLAEFDGRSRRTYLSGENIRAIAADDSGNIWAGLYGSGVMELKHGNWISYTTSNSGLPSNFINFIAIDRRDNKWIATDGGGLAVYNSRGVDKSFTLPPPPLPVRVDLNRIITAESNYIDSCSLSSGAIIISRSMLYTFQGSPHYEVCPYFSNFAALGLLDNPTPTNVAIVKNWMIWVFNHLNSDGYIYDYYVDRLNGGAELPSVDAYARENIADYDSKDSYAATFLTLARRYAEVVPADSSWLKGYSQQLESIGKALYSTVDDSNHTFVNDNNDGLTVAKLDYQVKYTMDNSEVNEGLRNMVWLEQNIIRNGDPSFYQNLLKNNTDGFANLWNSGTLTYYPYKGSSGADWNIFYPDAACRLWPILCGVISPASPRAVNLYNRFNSYYPDWQIGGEGAWSSICYVAVLMNDTTRVNSYLSYVQDLLGNGLNPTDWLSSDAGFIIRAAKRLSRLTGIKEGGRLSPDSPGDEQNYPNPFNLSTTIKVSLCQTEVMSLKIYNVLGQLVKVVDEGYKPAGEYVYEVNMENFGSGVYFYALQQGNNTVARKMILMK